MAIKLKWQNILAFLLLVLLVQETQQLIRMSVVHLFAHDYGKRDFLVFFAPDSSIDSTWGVVAATAAVSVLTWFLVWMGAAFKGFRSLKLKGVGFALILANLPLGRFVDFMLGRGDESRILMELFGYDYSHTGVLVRCGAVLLPILGIPVFIAFRRVSNPYTWLYVLGFLGLPIAFVQLYLGGLLNRLLLQIGLLDKVWVMGTPLLIAVHTGIVLVLLVIFRKGLFMFLLSEETVYINAKPETDDHIQDFMGI